MRLVLAAGLILAGLLPQEGKSPLDSGAILELTLPAPPGVRGEWFRLDRERGAEEPVGLVRQIVVVEPGGNYRLEQETLFLDAAVRVLHVETLQPDELTLVWREIGERHGRTVLVEWDLNASSMRCADTEGGEVRRRRIEIEDGALMPLYLLEKLRAGHLSTGRFRCFRPIAGALEELELRLLPPSPFWGNARILEWRRADGGLAGRFAFRGRDLVSFRWQEGGPLATAIGEDEYRRLRASLWVDPSND